MNEKHDRDEREDRNEGKRSSFAKILQKVEKHCLHWMAVFEQTSMTKNVCLKEPEKENPPSSLSGFVETSLSKNMLSSVMRLKIYQFFS